MYFVMFVLFLGHLQQNIHKFTMIVTFLGIFIILLSVAYTMFVALLVIIIILFLCQLYVLWLSDIFIRSQ